MLWRWQLLLATCLVAPGSPLGAGPRAIVGPWPQAFPAKDLCSNCGLCKSSVGVAHVTDACAFLGDGMARVEQLEPRVHGRGRHPGTLDEAHFGVHETILLARGTVEGAQWTGVCTGIALAMLESGAVDAVVVTGARDDDGFGAPQPVLARTANEVLRGRRVKPSLCPSLEVLDEVAEDTGIRRLLFCGVGCSVQALRAMGGAGGPERALGLDPGGLFVLGTHCVDNSPTPEAASRFVSAVPGVGPSRAGDVLAYEFMADFRVHARLRAPRNSNGGGEGKEQGQGEEHETVKAAYMCLPPDLGVPSIARSCFACFDYTNGLADLVVGYMGAPFDAGADEMTTAPLMVTVRNPRGRAMLDQAVTRGRVLVLTDGGRGGANLPSSGDRRAITSKTVESDSMVRSLTDPTYVPADRGAPTWVGELLARVLRAFVLPTGLEFARFSIDYHFVRNVLFVEATLGPERAAQHVPEFARRLAALYADDLATLREAAGLGGGGLEEEGGGGGGGEAG